MQRAQSEKRSFAYSGEMLLYREETLAANSYRRNTEYANNFSKSAQIGILSSNGQVCLGETSSSLEVAGPPMKDRHLSLRQVFELLTSYLARACFSGQNNEAPVALPGIVGSPSKRVVPLS